MSILARPQRHAFVTMIACAFLQHRRLAPAGKKETTAAASANSAHRTLTTFSNCSLDFRRSNARIRINCAFIFALIV
jgi:hypothetical protein